jgi:hypothetical protein
MVYEVEKLKIKERGKNCNFKLCIIGKREKKGSKESRVQGGEGKRLKTKDWRLEAED